MGRVEMSTRLGVNCGRRPTILLLLVSAIYFLAAMAYTLTTRLYLRAYYCSAHVSAMAAIVGLFVLSHHLLRLKATLGCSAVCFLAFQVVLNLLYMIACGAAAVAYTILAASAHAWNFDHIASAVWAWSATLWLLYLLSLTTVAANPNRHSVATFGHLDAYATTIPNITDNGNLDFEMDQKKYVIPGESTFTPGNPQKTRCSRCCLGCIRFVLGLLYALMHLLLLVAFFLTAFYPSAVTVDVLHNRYSRAVYEVSIEGHRPVSMFLSCVGNGNETIMYENTIGELALLLEEDVPRLLSAKYRVCAHHRRGVGWSDSVESDFIENSLDERDVSITDAQYLRALVAKAGVPVPFFYIGHGYGTRSVLETVSSAPDMVKAAIFLDDLKSTNLKVSKSLMEIGANFRATGIVWAAFDLGFLDLSDLLNVDGLSNHRDAMQAFRSGTSLETFVRELQSNETPLNLEGKQFVVPMLSIHTSGINSLMSLNNTWLNVHNFPITNSTFVYAIPQDTMATSYTTSSNYTRISYNLIDAFVNFVHDPAQPIRPIDGAVKLNLKK